jgi:hypothetical protein
VRVPDTSVAVNTANEKRAELRFGPLSIDADDVVASFTHENVVIAQIAQELTDALGKSISIPEATHSYRLACRHAAAADLLNAIAAAEAYARAVFAEVRVPLDEGHARQIVIQHARGERYAKAKELVVAAAGYVRAQELREAMAPDASGTPTKEPSWETVYLARDLAIWATAAGLHREIEVNRGTARANAQRTEDKNRRIQKMSDAIRRGEVQPTAKAIVAWRDEELTPATRERARRDLIEAGFGLARARKKKNPKRR